MEDVFVHDLAVVDEGASIGTGSKIWHFVHIRERAVIGKNVIVGKSCYIDTGVVIGDNVKIQNLVSVYDGVRIGDDVFVGPHVVFTNDLYPRAFGDWTKVETRVDQGASIGANSTILCGITMGQYCLVAAGSVVTRDIPAHGLVVGNPAKLVGWVCFCSRKLAGDDLPPGRHDLTCQHCGKTVSISIP